MATNPPPTTSNETPTVYAPAVVATRTLSQFPKSKTYSGSVGGSSLQTFKSFARLHFERARLDDRGEVLAMLMEMTDRAARDRLQVLLEKEMEEGLRPTTMKDVWDTLEDMFETEACKAARREEAWSKLLDRVWRSPDHRNESPHKFVEDLRKLII